MQTLALFIPSRGRPESCRDCVQSFRRTSSPETAIFVLLDEGDSTLPKYKELAVPGVVYLVGADGKYAQKMNEAWARLPFYDYYGLGADDTRCKTEGWDCRMLEVMEEIGGFGLVYPEDLHRGKDHSNHFIISGKFLGALGYFCLPALSHNWVDMVLATLARAIDKFRFCPDVVWEHCHHNYLKSSIDAIYEASAETYEPGERIYREWLRTGFDTDLAKVRAAMEVVSGTSN